LSTAPFLAEFPDTWTSTRATLHAYARAVGVVPRAHAVSRPRWWHVALEVRPSGLVAEPIAIPGGGALQLRMDLLDHAVFLERSDGSVTRFAMDAGLSGTEFGERILDTLAAMGIRGDYERSRFEDEDAGDYDSAAVRAFFATLVNLDGLFRRIRVSLPGEGSPVNFWPHGFDLAFEWFGSRLVEQEEEGEVTHVPAQINLGFYSGGRPYFYSNPWPFDPALTSVDLPHGAQWHDEGWQGSILYYDEIVGDPDAPRKIEEYARAVHAAAAPGLTA
jgi:hypothetical protein